MEQAVSAEDTGSGRGRRGQAGVEGGEEDAGSEDWRRRPGDQADREVSR